MYRKHKYPLYNFRWQFDIYQTQKCECSGQCEEMRFIYSFTFDRVKTNKDYAVFY